MPHTHRYAIIEPTSGRYWNGRSGGLRDEPHYWYDEGQVRGVYADYLEYCAERVHDVHPQHLRLLTEQVVYAAPVVSDLAPADHPDHVLRGAFRRYFRKRVGCNRNWAVEAFLTRGWGPVRPALVAMARIKRADAASIKARVAGAAVVNYYGDQVVGVMTRGDILILRACFEVIDVIDLDPFWADVAQRHPGVRPVTNP